MSLFKSLFGLGGYKEKYKNVSKEMLACLSENEILISENTYLRLELEKKQEQINKTNSYWKGVIRDLKKKKPAKTKTDIKL